VSSQRDDQIGAADALPKDIDNRKLEAGLLEQPQRGGGVLGLDVLE
jgi:hypothetical protein